jgi:hypothetical protein
MRVLLLLVCLLAACERPTASPVIATLAPSEPEPAPAPPPAATPAPTTLPDAALILSDPASLSQLEAQGLALHRVLDATGAPTATLLASSAIYRDFFELLSLDDAVAKERDPNARTSFSATHRLFDIRWLKSERTRFELVGVVNRADRVFATPDSCGELRLIYRLAYTAPRVSSRLPLTLSLVFAQGQGSDLASCKEVAERWLALEREDQSALATAALAGSLSTLSRSTLRRVETNFQSGRWPSAVRPTLGGHAEYVLRSFRAENDRLVLATLENTPTQKLAASGRAALTRWITDNAEAIDAGTALLPAALLAERSVSVQPHGASRLASRPFTQIAGVADAALARRLDQLSCKGCHATRSLAGFHLLGEDPATTTPFNAIAVGLSPHLLAELPFRRTFLEALARGERLAEPRPFADRGSHKGLLGEACGLGDPAFASWTCAEGLICKDRLGDVVGTCASIAGNALGDAVELGRMTQERTGLRDRVQDLRVEPCAPYEGQPAKAALSSNGFPGGMCHAPCTTFGDRHGAAICGPLPFGKGTTFDGITACLTVHDQPFDRCLADDAHPTWLKHCDRATPCRDDYLCVRVPNTSPQQGGACVPPYFLFQVRVDGHSM